MQHGITPLPCCNLVKGGVSTSSFCPGYSLHNLHLEAGRKEAEEGRGGTYQHARSCLHRRARLPHAAHNCHPFMAPRKRYLLPSLLPHSGERKALLVCFFLNTEGKTATRASYMQHEGGTSRCAWKALLCHCSYLYRQYFWWRTYSWRRPPSCWRWAPTRGINRLATWFHMYCHFACLACAAIAS